MCLGYLKAVQFTSNHFTTKTVRHLSVASATHVQSLHNQACALGISRQCHSRPTTSQPRTCVRYPLPVPFTSNHFTTKHVPWISHGSAIHVQPLHNQECALGICCQCHSRPTCTTKYTRQLSAASATHVQRAQPGTCIRYLLPVLLTSNHFTTKDVRQLSVASANHVQPLHNQACASDISRQCNPRPTTSQPRTCVRYLLPVPFTSNHFTTKHVPWISHGSAIHVQPLHNQGRASGISCQCHSRPTTSQPSMCLGYLKAVQFTSNHFTTKTVRHLSVARATHVQSLHNQARALGISWQCQSRPTTSQPRTCVRYLLPVPFTSNHFTTKHVPRVSHGSAIHVQPLHNQERALGICCQCHSRPTTSQPSMCLGYLKAVQFTSNHFTTKDVLQVSAASAIHVQPLHNQACALGISWQCHSCPTTSQPRTCVRYLLPVPFTSNHFTTKHVPWVSHGSAIHDQPLHNQGRASGICCQCHSCPITSQPSMCLGYLSVRYLLPVPLMSNHFTTKHVPWVSHGSAIHVQPLHNQGRVSGICCQCHSRPITSQPSMCLGYLMAVPFTSNHFTTKDVRQVSVASAIHVQPLHNQACASGISWQWHSRPTTSQPRTCVRYLLPVPITSNHFTTKHVPWISHGSAIHVQPLHNQGRVSGICCQCHSCPTTSQPSMCLGYLMAVPFTSNHFTTKDVRQVSAASAIHVQPLHNQACASGISRQCNSRPTTSQPRPCVIYLLPVPLMSNHFTTKHVPWVSHGSAIHVQPLHNQGRVSGICCQCHSRPTTSQPSMCLGYLMAVPFTSNHFTTKDVRQVSVASAIHDQPLHSLKAVQFTSNHFTTKHVPWVSHGSAIHLQPLHNQGRVSGICCQCHSRPNTSQPSMCLGYLMAVPFTSNHFTTKDVRQVSVASAIHVQPLHSLKAVQFTSNHFTTKDVRQVSVASAIHVQPLHNQACALGISWQCHSRPITS
ncbi:hypothetical protein NDU88_008828 [Pleurodeles waltl]|uniref:Uncharacterized protein n=1 Tax=Pleurodeles waltl TaxID=8319 RepID=A0AAV7N7L2_PLEWA|nr:hypothetical protein NDU88_008828 [Pleurodeles waltl]